MSNIIFYFTGTGNSLKVARDIASSLGNCKLALMNKEYKLDESYENIGFVYPVYCAALPRAVENFISSLDFSKNKDSYIFAVSTSGASGGGLGEINKILNSKGRKLSYGNDVRSFSNYLILYAMTQNKEEKSKKQAIKTAEVIEDIKSKKTVDKFKINGLVTFLHGLFLKYQLKADKDYNVNDNCNGCGTCCKVCPVSNIEMKNNKPAFLGHCEQCVACIHWCPNEAINYKNKTQNRGRYHHPDITVIDIIQNKL